MTASTPNRLGFKDGASGGSFAQDHAMNMDVYGGEVMTAFQETNVMADKHRVQTIKEGRSARFPAMGKTVATYHVPGNEILGKTVNENERIINVDRLLISDTFLDGREERMIHFDVRSPITTQQGRALALRFDQNILKLEVLAARSAATVSGGVGGGSSNNAAYATTGQTLADGIFIAAQTFDEKDIPDEDRYCAVRPAQYYLLAKTTNLLNKDWGGSGAYAEGEILKVAGVTLVKTNNLPSTTIASATTGENNTYFGDFSVTTAVVFNKQAVGTVKLMDLMVESAYDIRRQGTLYVSKYAMGHGILRPECAFELRTGNPA